MNPMSTAPRDGTRILLCYWPLHFTGYPFSSWQRTPEPKWEEFHYVTPKPPYHNNPHWEEWTGCPRTQSSNHVRESNCIGWLPVPQYSQGS